MDSGDHSSSITAKKVIYTSFIVDLSDVILSIIVTILSGSVVMLSQTLEGLSDLVASGLLIVGVRRSIKRSDKAHPFGYGREVYFWSLLAGLVMFGITATFSFYLGLQRYLNPEPLHNLPAAFIILTVTLLTNSYAFSLSFRRLLKKHHPKQIMHIFFRSSLIETKTTLVLDFMGTVASILGIIALVIYQITGDLRFDGLGAMAIGIALGVLAYLLLVGIRDLLIGKSASFEVENQIRKTTLGFPLVKHVIGVKTLHIGSEKLLVNLDVHLDHTLTTREIEKLIDDIKEQIRIDVPEAKQIQVELETPRKPT